jgi:hypothetical protein
MLWLAFIDYDKVKVKVKGVVYKEHVYVCVYLQL